MTNPLLFFIIILIVCAVGLVVVKLRRLPLQRLIVAISGMLVGLLIGALLSVPVGKLPSPYGDVLPLVISLLSTIGLLAVAVNQKDISGLLTFMHPKQPTKSSSQSGPKSQVLVDTSVIIDGRFADIAKAGFLRANLLIPRFVLAELQNIADSDDAMRRGRGRRGLEMLHDVRTHPGVASQIIEDDLQDIKEVDAKLVGLAKKLGADVLTTDYNLNRVAQIEGVRVLNVNELANAIRPVALPGEEMIIKIVQAGKEKGQGVGYLADGTMIVVENGDKLIGQEVATEVSRVFQTVAGKMIFAIPKQRPGSIQRPSTISSQTPSPNQTDIQSQATNLKSSRKNNQRKRSNHNGHTASSVYAAPSGGVTADRIEDWLVKENSTK